MMCDWRREGVVGFGSDGVELSRGDLGRVLRSGGVMANLDREIEYKEQRDGDDAQRME